MDHVGLGQALEEDDELLSSVAADGVRLAEAAAQQGGQRREHAVTDGMAEAIVDGLEVVEVDHHPGEMPGSVATFLRMQGLGALDERGVGEQPREAVAIEEVLQEARALQA